jgi:tetrahydromethanopterin S-methyltransferase subunit G
LQNSIYNSFGVLAVLPQQVGAAAQGVEDMALLMCVLEMWMCLVLRTLPDGVLEEWLPRDGSVSVKRREGREGVFGGLNIVCPLDQGLRERGWVDLSGCEDVVVRGYLGLDRKEEERKKSDEQIVSREEMERRRRVYAESARRFGKNVGGDVAVPSWVVFGVGALTAVAGMLLLNSKGGPQRR